MISLNEQEKKKERMKSKIKKKTRVTKAGQTYQPLFEGITLQSL